MDQSKRSFIEQGLGLLAATGLAAGGGKTDPKGEVVDNHSVRLFFPA